LEREGITGAAQVLEAVAEVVIGNPHIDVAGRAGAGDIVGLVIVSEGEHDDLLWAAAGHRLV
jgi:hypothetical protein